MGRSKEKLAMRSFSVIYVFFCLLFIFESAMAQSTDEAEVIVCDDSFEPVCSSQGDTYANQCFANLDGAEIISEGVCNDPTLQCSLVNAADRHVSLFTKFSLLRTQTGILNPCP